LERKLRGGTSPLFDEFFALREGERAHYPLLTLSVLDDGSRARVFDEYLSVLFGTGAVAETRESSGALDRLRVHLSLPATASAQEIRRSFRRSLLELHPDHGGDAAAAADLIDLYRQAFE
jgi:hypothetical protein